MKTVLVVDDDSLVIRCIAQILANNYNVLTASDIKELSQTISTPTIDCILLDLTVRGSNFKQLMSLIRQHHPSTPIISMSGYTEDPHITNPQKYGLAGSLPKPFGIDALLDTIKNLCNDA
jgi:DNA-binding NtrC family response regulator